MEQIFKWFTSEGNDPMALTYITWFDRCFQPESFVGIDKLFAAYIKHCAYLNIEARRDYFLAWLKVDGKRTIKQYNIKVDSMNSYDYNEASQLEEAYNTIVAIATDTYDRYVAVDLTDRSFKVDVYTFMSAMKSDSIQNAMMEIYPHLTDGSDVTEVSAQLRNKLSSIDEMYDTGKIKEVDFTTAGETGTEMHYLCKTGLPCIDGDIGGVYTRIMYTINSQPGGGKTRLALVHWAYKVMTEAKKDALVYELELSESQIQNILIAYHITRLYAGRVKIPDSLMNKKDEMTPEQRQIYESAKIDLFESGKYGNFIVRNELIVERFQDELSGLIKTNPNLGIIIVDYAGLAESKPESRYGKRLEQFEIITEVYKTVRKILLTVDVSAVIINQYNDKGIDAAYAGKKIRSGHVQGGHIVQRHTDYDLSMTFTEEQELANVRCLSVSKRRGTAGFTNVLLQTDLSVSIFRQV